jgi:hypothetical protein
VTVTAALMVAVYAIVNGNDNGWTSFTTLGLLALSAALSCLRDDRVARQRALVPLRLFRLHNLRTANIVGVLWAAAMFAWFFLAALYLQLVLGYSPLEVGLVLPAANLIMGAFSLGLSAELVMRFGSGSRSRRARLARRAAALRPRARRRQLPDRRACRA